MAGRSPPPPAAPPRPNERPRRLGTVPPATPSPPAGWWARPGGQPPTHGTRNHRFRGFGIRDRGSAPLAPAAVSVLGGAVPREVQLRKPASATTGPDNGHSGGRRTTVRLRRWSPAPAHSRPRNYNSYLILARPPCRGAPLPSGRCSKSTSKRAVVASVFVLGSCGCVCLCVDSFLELL